MSINGMTWGIRKKDKAMDVYSYEMRLLKCKAKRKDGRWRWDLTVYENVDGKYPGVKDTRNHMGGGGFGYARTRFGALWSIYKAYVRSQKDYPIYG